MATEYGTKISRALKAIAQMHADTSRLLVDCDKYVGKGRASIFGSYATRDLTYSYKADFWMAQGMYRYYPAGPETVDGVTIAFFSTDRRTEIEPLLIVGRIQYSPKSDGDSQPPNQTKGKCSERDLWNLYFNWGSDQDIGKVLMRENADNGRVLWARLIATPLFSVDDIKVVVQLADQIVASSPDKSTAVGTS